MTGAERLERRPILGVSDLVADTATRGMDSSAANSAMRLVGSIDRQ